jgi:hypothetical protein
VTPPTVVRSDGLRLLCVPTRSRQVIFAAPRPRLSFILASNGGPHRGAATEPRRTLAYARGAWPPVARSSQSTLPKFSCSGCFSEDEIKQQQSKLRQRCQIFGKAAEVRTSIGPVRSTAKRASGESLS